MRSCRPCAQCATSCYAIIADLALCSSRCVQHYTAKRLLAGWTQNTIQSTLLGYQLWTTLRFTEGSGRSEMLDFVAPRIDE